MKTFIFTLSALLSLSSFAGVINIISNGDQYISNASLHCTVNKGSTTFYTDMGGVKFSENTIELDYVLLGEIDRTCSYARLSINTSEMINNVRHSELYIIDLDTTENFNLVVYEKELFLRKTNKSIDDRQDHFGDHIVSGMKKAGEIIGLGAFLLFNPGFNGIP